jgi:hypothetical protein
MKSSIFAILIVAPMVHAAPIQMQDAATNVQLSQKLRIMEQSDPMKKLPIANVEDPAKNSPKDIISQSDMISFEGMTTLVPKMAIMQIPKAYADRIKYVSGNQIISWADFFALNRGWITNMEISRAQAEGNEPLPEATMKVLSQSGNLIVATFMGGPISKLPSKSPINKNATESQKP